MKILGDSAALPQSTRQQITNADYADHQCSANVGALPERGFEGIEGDALGEGVTSGKREVLTIGIQSCWGEKSHTTRVRLTLPIQPGDCGRQPMKQFD